MRASILACALLVGCAADALEVQGELSGGGTGGSGGFRPVEHPDFPLEAQLVPDRLDLPPQALCGAFDILFVIDNSGSMEEDQERMAANIPTFLGHLSVLGVGAEGGIHIGVVTTDNYSHNPTGCQSVGALVTRTGPKGGKEDGKEGPETPCGPYADGFNFMTEADDLEEAFTCAALVGAEGSGLERPADAMIEALDDWHGRPGGCNDRFHRLASTNGDSHEERAALLVVFITDEDDQDSLGPWWEWAEHVDLIRGGGLDDVVFIGLFPDLECATQNATNLNRFMDEVPYSLVGSICDKDFGQFFIDAVPFVAAGCGLGTDPEP